MSNYKLSWDLIFWAFVCGFMLSCVYCSLLWYSVKKLPHIKRKGLFLLFSSVFRMILFVAIAILLAIRSPILLLCMFVSFTVTRFIIVRKKGVTC